MTDRENNTEIFDNGRRGEPLPGCDCVRCFGYCLIDRDAEARIRGERAAERAKVRAEIGDALHDMEGE